MTSPLFRTEAVAAAQSRLEGDVILSQPKWMLWLALGMPALAAIGFGVLLSWSYPRVQAVAGWISTDKGLVQIRAQRGGVIETVFAAEGAKVRAGDKLAVFRLETEQPEAGGSAEEALLRVLTAEAENLKAQADLAEQQFKTQEQRLKDTIGGLIRERAGLDSQIARAGEIATAARRDAEAAEDLLARGFATQREVRSRRATWSGAVRDELSLRQSRDAMRTRIDQTQADLARLPMERESQLARLRSQVADLEQRRTEVQGRRRYAVVAPVAGTIVNVTARLGYVADPARAVMAIVPDGATFEAELFLPTAAAGFVRAGQPVRLQLDAFPYQRFGAVSAKVTQVSPAAMAAADLPLPVQSAEPVYLVRAGLVGEGLTAFGERVTLKPGMTLRAVVQLEERTLWQWIFEPLYAVRGR